MADVVAVGAGYGATDPPASTVIGLACALLAS
jgi:hypothetical protein